VVVVVVVDGSCGLEEKDEKVREVVVCAESSLMLRVCIVVVLLLAAVAESSRGFGGTWRTFSASHARREGEARERVKTKRPVLRAADAESKESKEKGSEERAKQAPCGGVHLSRRGSEGELCWT
jgi:hypothetical protein